MTLPRSASSLFTFLDLLTISSYFITIFLVSIGILICQSICRYSYKLTGFAMLLGMSEIFEKVCAFEWFKMDTPLFAASLPSWGTDCFFLLWTFGLGCWLVTCRKYFWVVKGNYACGSSRGLVVRTLGLFSAGPGFKSDKSHWWRQEEHPVTIALYKEPCRTGNLPLLQFEFNRAKVKSVLSKR